MCLVHGASVPQCLGLDTLSASEPRCLGALVIYSFGALDQELPCIGGLGTFGALGASAPRCPTALTPRCFGALGSQECPCIGGLGTFSASVLRCLGNLQPRCLGALPPLAVKSIAVLVH
ncbi:UNVERIFIED_CONTAM: hypothetical protein FKN15_043536 [Acipenser sinensis]